MMLCSKGRTLDLSTPQVMGILNITPDSFSDGSRFCQLEQALTHAAAMVQAGATLIDVGGNQRVRVPPMLVVKRRWLG